MCCLEDIHTTSKWSSCCDFLVLTYASVIIDPFHAIFDLIVVSIILHVLGLVDPDTLKSGGLFFV